MVLKNLSKNYSTWVAGRAVYQVAMAITFELKIQPFDYRLYSCIDALPMNPVDLSIDDIAGLDCAAKSAIQSAKTE